MRFSDLVSMCFRNLWRRKGRTFLTVIGVVIGSCAIIVMISLGLGMNAAMDNMLKSWGDINAVTIYSGNEGMYYGGGMSSSSTSASGEKPKLDDKMLATLSSIEHVETVFPSISVPSEYITVSAGKNNRYVASWAEISGVDFSLLDKMGFTAESGEWPEKGSTKYLVFGNESAYNFRDTKKRNNNMVWKEPLPDGTFRQPFFDPMTEDILIYVNNSKKQDDKTGLYQSGGRGYEFKMKVGSVIAPTESYEYMYKIYMDMDMAKTLIYDYNRLNAVKNYKMQYSSIKLWVDDIDNVEAVQNEVDKMGLNSSSMIQARKQMQGQLLVIQLVLGGLAAISLLVAAIGITNTMIMSIYERTREIGVMKVLGCFISNIRVLFLMEAGMIGLMGGVMGTAISYGISIVLNTVGKSFMQNFIGGDGSTAISIIPLWLVLLALGFSTCVGLISGFYPANRAVKISAMEAIKNE